MDIFGVAGEFAAVDGQVVAPLEAGIDAQLLQGLDDGLREASEVDLGAVGVRAAGDEGEVQIAQIVEDRPAAG